MAAKLKHCIGSSKMQVPQGLCALGKSADVSEAAKASCAEQVCKMYDAKCQTNDVNNLQ